MPDTQYKEVLITVVSSMALFLVLATIILAFLFQYQRRRRLQQQQVLALEQQFKEQTLRSQLEIQEQTFQAIGREIHDNVGQVLSLAKVQVNIIRESPGVDARLLDEVKDNIGKAMSDLRDLSRSLDADRLKDNTLQEVIVQEADRINRTGLIRVAVQVEGDCREIQSQRKLILFRIVQESIQNCLKHAAATRMDIYCRYRDNELIIQIQDDGVGFDPEAAFRSGRGQGLHNMNTRIHLIGGAHHIRSALSEGTHITLTIPYA